VELFPAEDVLEKVVVVADSVVGDSVVAGSVVTKVVDSKTYFFKILIDNLVY